MVHGYLAAESLLLIAAPSGPLHATSIHPELVESHVTNPNMIHEISKLRSGAEHDFSCDASFAYAGEYFSATDASDPDSSMKHSFRPYDIRTKEMPVYASLDGVPCNSRCDGLKHHLPPDDEQLTAADSLHCRM